MDEPVRRAVKIDADAHMVWAALTDEGALADWFGAAAEIDLRRGGAIRFTWSDGRERRGVIVTMDPPRKLAFRWRAVAGGSSSDASVVTFALEPHGDGTCVQVIESPGILDEETGRIDLAEVSP